MSEFQYGKNITSPAYLTIFMEHHQHLNPKPRIPLNHRSGESPSFLRPHPHPLQPGIPPPKNAADYSATENAIDPPERIQNFTSAIFSALKKIYRIFPGPGTFPGDFTQSGTGKFSDLFFICTIRSDPPDLQPMVCLHFLHRR